ncbi:hypothetical protein JCM16418A_40170 [Paenibacillus pini]
MFLGTSPFEMLSKFCVDNEIYMGFITELKIYEPLKPKNQKKDIPKFINTIITILVPNNIKGLSINVLKIA